MTTSDRPVCFLFDNGSLRASSTRSLRSLAARLEPVIGVPVKPVSLLHSSAVPASALDGVSAKLLEPALDAFFRGGGQAAVALPLFFGPSAALTEYLPGRLAALREKYPHGQLRLARELVLPEQPEDKRMAAVLADGVRAVITAKGLLRPAVLLVDHGSPQADVTAVREHLAGQMRALLDNRISIVGTASMERRPGEAFAFNEPLLETALVTPPFNAGELVIALQFLSPGRHAGPEGDIARICDRARLQNQALRVHLTEPVAGHPGLLPVLADRYRESLTRDS